MTMLEFSWTSFNHYFNDSWDVLFKPRAHQILEICKDLTPISTVCELTGIHSSHIYRYIDDLQKSGFIHRSRIGMGKNASFQLSTVYMPEQLNLNSLKHAILSTELKLKDTLKPKLPHHDLGVSKATVYRLFKQLKDDGYIDNNCNVIKNTVKVWTRLEMSEYEFMVCVRGLRGLTKKAEPIMRSDKFKSVYGNQYDLDRFESLHGFLPFFKVLDLQSTEVEQQ